MPSAEATLAPTKSAAARRVILASSLGTVFEWYDFYLYGSLAVFFGGLFFPQGNETASFLASLATFGAGFAVRPFGALVFGRLGDLAGRKHTFLLTILIILTFGALSHYRNRDAPTSLSSLACSAEQRVVHSEVVFPA